ncbi:unnamed protein product [Cercospora beticola]|nr:unnamed protein product [Cercospora beticola]
MVYGSTNQDMTKLPEFSILTIEGSCNAGRWVWEIRPRQVSSSTRSVLRPLPSRDFCLLRLISPSMTLAYDSSLAPTQTHKLQPTSSTSVTLSLLNRPACFSAEQKSIWHSFLFFRVVANLPRDRTSINGESVNLAHHDFELDSATYSLKRRLFLRG